MINSKEEDDFLSDYDYIKSIQSKRKFMDYGLSEYKDNEENIQHYKKLQNKIYESQEQIEDNLNFIEKIANNNQPIKRKKGELFNRNDNKARRNTKRRGATIKNIPYLIKNDIHKGLQIHDLSSKVYTSELTNRENNRNTNTDKVKDASVNKKSLNLRENFCPNESEERSKFNLSVLKSERNKKSEKSITFIIPNDKNLMVITNIDIIDNNKESMPMRRKINNIKKGSILKNSSLFLTNVEELKHSENILDLETNNFSTNNYPDQSENKRSSINLFSIYEENPSKLPFEALEKKIIKKPQGVSFDLRDKQDNQNNLNKKINKEKSSNTNKFNNNNNNSKSANIDRTTRDPNCYESHESEIKENAFYIKKAKKDKAKKSLIILNDNNEKANKDEKENKNKELNLNAKFDSKKNLINLSFSNSDSNGSFMNLNPKGNKTKNNNLLLKGKLPPLKISNSESQSIDFQTLDYKIKSRNSTHNRNDNFSIENTNINNSENYYAMGDDLDINTFSPNNKKIAYKKIIKSPSKQSNQNNLKLPKLVLHQKNKSHFDILNTVTKELKTVGNLSIKFLNNKNLINLNKSLSPLNNSIKQSFTNQDERALPEIETEFNNTQENQIRLINTRRIKQKMLPLELDKPKYNNSKQNLRSQMFLKSFFSKCKNQQTNISSMINEIASNATYNNSNYYFKNTPINFGKKTDFDLESKQIDKEVFHLDYPKGIREQAVTLKGPPIHGENKYLFENKNSPMVIGEVISKMDEGFGLKCKNVIQSRFIVFDELTKKRIKFAKDKKQIDLHIAKISGIHTKIERECENMEKIKINAMKMTKNNN